jgi:hypothetical protein
VAKQAAIVGPKMEKRNKKESDFDATNWYELDC